MSTISAELEKKIHDTINKLIEENKKPTYEAIRIEGGYSYNSIKPALKSWKEERKASGDEREQQSADVEVDEDLKALAWSEIEDVLGNILVTVTQQAQQKADEKLKLERSAHDESVKEFQNEISSLESYIALSDEDNEALKSLNEWLVNTKDRLGEDNERLTDENKSLKRDALSLETDNKELKDTNRQLLTDLTKQTAENAALQETATKCKAELEDLQKQYMSLQAKNNEQLSEIAELKGRVKSFEKSDQELRAELNSIKAKHDDFVTEIATLKQQNKQLTADNFTLEQQTPDDLAKSAVKSTSTANGTASSKTSAPKK